MSTTTFAEFIPSLLMFLWANTVQTNEMQQCANLSEMTMFSVGVSLLVMFAATVVYLSVCPSGVAGSFPTRLQTLTDLSTSSTRRHVSSQGERACRIRKYTVRNLGMPS
jgi:hypothetical protein